MDSSRKFDLEDVAEAIKRARSVSEREYYEHLMYRLVNESTSVTSLRNDLIAAMRAGDTRVVKRIRDHINYVRAEETMGASWGSNKGNRITR